MRNKGKSLSVTTQLAISFGTILFFLFLITALTIWKMWDIRSDFNHFSDVTIPTVQNTLKILSGVHETQSDLSNFLMGGNQTLKLERKKVWANKINHSLNSLLLLENEYRQTEILEQLRRLQTGLNELQAFQDEVENTATKSLTLAQQQFLSKGHVFEEQLSNAIDTIIKHENNYQIAEVKSLHNEIFYLSTAEWILLVLGLIVGTFASLRLGRNIGQPIVRLAKITQAMAQGYKIDKVPITGPKEIRKLNRSLNNMIETQNEITQLASKIAEGDYEAEIKSRSEQDDLMFSLQHMTKTLQKNKTYNEEQVWLQNGSAEVIKIISQNNKLKDLTSSVLNEICHYLEAGIGALYLEEDDNQSLNLVSSFAFTERDALASHFHYGEGIVGQVAVERKSILLKNIKRSEIVINTAITEEPPLNVYTFPLIDKSELIGVVSLGFHDMLSELKIKYIEQIIPIFSSSIRVIEQKLKTEDLLEEQRSLSEELQTQQEELKSSNEELEAQTEELKTSEEELRVRDEEQRNLNTELETHNKRLEAQKIELEKIREELIAKSEDLGKASKYKSEFLANMSHELRTPLNSLLILAKMLSDNQEGNLNDDQIESAQVIYSSGQELLQLINDILDLAKVEAGKLNIEITEIELKELATNLERDYRHVAKNKNLQFSTEVSQDAPKFIYSDNQRIRQILKNLITNAIKFTDQGSVNVHFEKDNKDGFVKISVTDTGVGIPKEQHELIFQTFYQCDGSSSRKYGGAGLGLSISTQLTNLLGGEISMTSETGKGSTFFLSIPVNSPDMQNVIQDLSLKKEENIAEEKFTPKPVEPISTVESFENPEVFTKGGEKSLLIIEDDIQFANILKNVCEKKGFTCWHALNGSTGIELALQHKPAGILLDVNLPDSDGIVIADKLKQKEQTQNIPIHFISGVDKKEEALKHGAASFLMKPISIEQLNVAFQAITRAVDTKINKLLIIEDDENLRNNISKIFIKKSVTVKGVGTGREALEALRKEDFDCMILDLGLPDMTGFDVLKKSTEDTNSNHPPVIIYTGRELTEDENQVLQSYSDNIVIKGKASLERLLDETTLFLHQVEKTIPEKNKPASNFTLDQQQQLKGKKVLLVDDDMRNTFALAKLLRGYGVTVSIAPNGQAGIEVLQNENDVDAVLMDIMMPIMDGFQAIEKIRKDLKMERIPIIVLTAKTMQSDREKCLELGATDFLTKPVDMEKLLYMLRAWL